MTTETEARQHLADLHDRRAQVELRQQTLHEQADNLSFDALALGDAKAKSKLDKTNAAIIEIERELASFDAALREGEARLEEARGASRAAVEKANAERVLKLARCSTLPRQPTRGSRWPSPE